MYMYKFNGLKTALHILRSADDFVGDPSSSKQKTVGFNLVERRFKKELEKVSGLLLRQET